VLRALTRHFPEFMDAPAFLPAGLATWVTPSDLDDKLGFRLVQTIL